MNSMQKHTINSLELALERSPQFFSTKYRIQWVYVQQSLEIFCPKDSSCSYNVVVHSKDKKLGFTHFLFRPTKLKFFRCVDDYDNAK